jgi:hypothetical protein
MQHKMPIAFYSRKLNTAHSGIQTLKQTKICYQLLKPARLQVIQEYPVRFHQPIIVFTDHENNTFNGLKASDRVLR